jgi:triosephosphate isomerase
MNTTQDGAIALTKELLAQVAKVANAELVVCPPAVWLQTVGELVEGTPIKLGGQDCHHLEFGPHTGDTSPAMLRELGCQYVIVGHSERREYHHETSYQVRVKAENALHYGLTPIICVGEKEAERDSGYHHAVVLEQLLESVPKHVPGHRFVVAYEPVWAIGTGKTASTYDVAEMHAFIRDELAKFVDHADQVRLLYGGSVKSANAKEILSRPNVDGVLVGGASLSSEDFIAIATATL